MIRLFLNGVVAEIAEKGAEMRVFRTKDGKNRLWSGDPRVWPEVSPILFPVIGRLKHDTVRIAGSECPMPMHGFAKNMTFTPREQTADHCTLVLWDSAETREIYPFAFQLSVTHRITEKGFVTAYTAENRGESVMPFVIGGHPGFACPMNEREAFSDYRIVFEKEEEGRTLACMPGGMMGAAETIDLGMDHRTLALSHETFYKKGTLVLAGLNSRSVMLIHRYTGKGIRFSFPESPVLAVWTHPTASAPYICLEPWNGLPAVMDETGDFENKPFHVALEPGGLFHTRYQMESLD